MKQYIDHDAIPSFLRSFYGFCDSVIRSIVLIYEENGSRTLELRLSARHSLVKTGHGWVDVDIVLEGISEMVVKEHMRTSMQVVSNGIHVAFFDNEIGLEFGGGVDAPLTLKDLRDSDGYALGSTLAFRIASDTSGGGF